MKSRLSTPRFEVDYKERLKQQRTAINAVRLPRLGFCQYRVYDIVEKKDQDKPSNLYGQHIGRGIRPGPISITAGGKYLKYFTSQIWYIIDDLESKTEPAHKVTWLKPKQATLLRLKGHRVEEI